MSYCHLTRHVKVPRDEKLGSIIQLSVRSHQETGMPSPPPAARVPSSAPVANRQQLISRLTEVTQWGRSRRRISAVHLIRH